MSATMRYRMPEIEEAFKEAMDVLFDADYFLAKMKGEVK